MKRTTLFLDRNRAIKKRFRELKKEGRNNAQCFDKMSREFWLMPGTIANIVWGNYERKAKN